MVTTEYGNFLASDLPDGFQTTLMDSDRLRDLSGADTSVLNGTVQEYSGPNNRNYTFTEEAVIDREVERAVTSFVTPEATLELPGTALAADNDLLKQFAAYYVNDNDTPSADLKPVELAGANDIVFTFATPEVFEEVSGVEQSNYVRSGLQEGTSEDIIGDNGLGTGANANTAGETLTLDSDEMMFFTGDFIELSGDAVLTKTQWANIDGEDYDATSSLFQSRLSGTQVITTQGAFVQTEADLDAKVYKDGDSEIVPVAFYMGPANKAPSLV